MINNKPDTSDMENLLNEHYEETFKTRKTMTTEKTNCLVCNGDGYTVEKIRSTIFNESFPMGEEKIPCKSCNENGTA
jgi:hypothetical protein